MARRWPTVLGHQRIELQPLAQVPQFIQLCALALLVHPTTKDMYTPHPVSAYTKGKGQAVGWFVFNGPASIDEVQIRMVDRKAKRTLAVVKHPVQAEWK